MYSTQPNAPWFRINSPAPHTHDIMITISRRSPLLKPPPGHVPCFLLRTLLRSTLLRPSEETFYPARDLLSGIIKYVTC